MCVCVFTHLQDDSAGLVGSVSELGFSWPGDGHSGGEYSVNVYPDRKTTALRKRTCSTEYRHLCMNECLSA